MRSKLILLALILFHNSVFAANTDDIEKQIKAHKQEIKAATKELKAVEKARKKEQKRQEKAERKARKKAEKLAKQVAKQVKKDAKKKARSQKPEAGSSIETIKLEDSLDPQASDLEPNKSDMDLLREELKANEAQALDFISPSIDTEEEALNKENFFSQTEKEQLLELWRSTLARNRTIQFIIKALASNPNEIEQKNAITQVLSKALFVPFYAVSAVANNSLISGGSMVGARVIGDVVDNTNGKKDRERQITKTDLIVLFMLVDEVAERLRNSYHAYKDAKVEQKLLEFDIQPARLDAAEALANNHTDSIFFTRMVVRDLERRLRQTELKYHSSRRVLVELAGEASVESVDLLIDLELEEIISDLVAV